MPQQEAILNVGATLAGQTQAAFRAVAQGFKGIASAMAVSAKEMKAMGNNDAAKKLNQFADAVNKATKEISQQPGKLNTLAKAYDHVTQEAEDFNTILKRVDGQLGKTTTSKGEKNLARIQTKYRELIKDGTELGNSARSWIAKLAPDIGDFAAYDILNQELARLQKQYAKMGPAEARLAAEFERTAKAVLKQDKVLDALGFKYRKLVSATDVYARSAQNLINQFVRTGGSIETLKRHLQSLSDLQKKAATEAKANAAAQLKAEKAKQIAAKKSRKAYIDLQLQYSKLLSGSNKYAASAQKIIINLKAQKVSADRAAMAMKILALRQKEAHAVMTPMGKVVDRLGTSFGRYLSYVAASSVVFAFIQQGREAIKTIIDYDQALRDLQAITRATSDEMVVMDRVIKQTASDTKFSAIETAEGVKILGQAGLSAAEAITAIPPITELATGTLSSLQTVVDLTTTAMRVFGIQANDVSRITDTFANAINTSKLNVDKLRIAFNYVGPVAAAAGMSIEDTAAALMVMANQGIRASTMGTSFKKIISELVAPNKALQSALDDAKMSIADLDVKTLGFQKVMENLKSIVTKNADAFAMFGQRAAPSILALVRHTDDLDRMRDVVDRTGAAADMATVQLAGLGLRFKNLLDKVKNLYIAMGDSGLVGVLTGLVDISRVVVDVMTYLADSAIGSVIMQVGLAVVAVRALTMAFNWFRKSTFITAFFSSFILSMKGATAAATGMTGATRGLTVSLQFLKGVLASNIFGVIVIGLGYVVSKMIGYHEALKLTNIELKNQLQRLEDNGAALKYYQESLDKGNISVKDHKEMIAALVKMYPLYKDEIELAAGSNDKLAVALGKVTEKEKERQKILLAEKLRTEAELLWEETRALANLQKGWGGWFRNEAKVQADILRTEDNIKKLKTSLLGTAAALDTVDIAKPFKGILNWKDLITGGDITIEAKRALIEGLKQAMADAEQISAEEGKKIGEAIATGIAEGVTEIDPKIFGKDQATQFKKTQAELEKNLAQTLYGMQVAEAKGLADHKVVELDKLNATIASYDKMVVAAQHYYNEVAEMGDEASQVKAQVALDAAIEKTNQVRLQKLQAYAKKHNQLQDKITKQTEDRTKEESDYEAKLLNKTAGFDSKKAKLAETTANKISDIEKSHYNKRVDAKKVFEDKIAELIKKRIDIEKSAATDVQSITDSIQDKIFNIQTKGMSEAAKQAATQSQANKKLQQGLAALEEARKTSDKAAIERAKELIEKSGEYYEGLENSGSAITGLKAVEKALIAARKAQEAAELKEVKGKISKEILLQRNKINVINRDELTAINKVKRANEIKLKTIIDGYDKAIAKENIRHKNEMADIAKEITELKKKQQIIRAMQDTVTATAPATVAKGLDVGDMTSESFNMDQYERDVGIATTKAITQGTADASRYMSDQIRAATAEGVNQGLFDGVKVEGIPLEEWKKQGKLQGEAMADNISVAIEKESKKDDFAIINDGEGVPISVSIDPATAKDTDELIESIQIALDAHPSEPKLDFEQAERMIQAFVTKAKQRYKITIPVSVSEAKSEGGPVYGMANGGRLPGTKSRKDKVPVLARPGEWFITDEVVSSWSRSVGDWFMQAVHRPASEAGTALKNMIQGAGARPKQVQVSAPSRAATPMNQTVQSLGTLVIKMGGRTTQILTTQADAYKLAEQFKFLEDSSS